MRQATPSGLRRYGAALAVSVLTTLLSLLLWRLAGIQPAFLILPAVVISAWYGGVGPGLLTALLCLLGSSAVVPSEQPEAEGSGALVEAGLYFLVTGGGSWLIAAMRSAQRRAEANRHALQASEERYRRLIETAYEGILTLDAKFRIDYVNRRLAEMLGRSPEELYGRPFHDLAGDPDRDEAERCVQQIRQGAGGRYDLRLRRQDGSDLWAIVSVSPIPGESGGVSGALAMVTDVTRDRQAEEERRRLNAELEQRVRDRTAQLETVNRELESFAYSVSHDLRTPLRSMAGFSQAILEDCGETLDERGKEHLHRVRAAAQRMGQLIDDLLNLSRLSRSTMQRKQVDLSLLGQQIAAELRKTAPERDVTLVIAEGLVADGDPNLLRVVLENLLSNAWKYTGPRPRARIEFGSRWQNDRQVYFVSDDGVGFDMTYADKLFGAFQRLHTAAEFEGTGIGLATVQRIIHRHGGQVWAEGEVDRGASVYFTL